MHKTHPHATKFNQKPKLPDSMDLLVQQGEQTHSLFQLRFLLCLQNSVELHQQNK